MNEPKLRFKADDGSQFPEWEEKRLEEIVGKISSGKDKACNGNYVLYGSTGIIGTCQSPTYKGRKILVARVGANAGTVNLVNDDCGVSDNTLIINNMDLCNFDWLYFYMVHKELGKMRFGSGQPLITGTMLRDLCIQLPNDFEQQKIAEFLSTIDTVIEKQKETVSAWEERKKGVMQKLFSQEVRFKADDGSEFPEWEEKKLSEMFKKVIEKNRLDLPPLTIVQGYGTIRRDESERRIAYDEKGLKNYKAVQKDDFIVHLRSFEGGLEIANQDGIVSPAYHVYRGNDEVHPSFYYPYFRSSSFIKGKLSICVTGVRDGKNIEMGSFDELLIPHPCLAEQQKIADCLSSFDEVIEKQKATLAAWEELKKGLLQQMFV